MITREGLVLQTCLTPSALDTVKRDIAQFIPTTQTNLAIDQAKRLSSIVFSLPYARSKNGILYSDLIYPVNQDRLYVARISITSMLRQFTGTTLDYRYKISLLVDGKEISAASAEEQEPQSALNAAPSDNIRATSPLTPLPESVRLLTVNTHMDSAYGYTKLVRSIVLFGCLLLLSTMGVLVYQYRQLKIEEELRARIIVQQAMSQSILDGLFVTDRLGKILYTNRAFNDLFKDESGEMLGMTPPYAFCPQDKSIFDFKRHLQENAAGDIVRAEFTASRKDGKMHISLVNTDLKNSKNVLVTFDNPKAVSKVLSSRVLTSKDVRDYNDFDKPEVVKPVEFKDYKFTKNGLEVVLPPCSVLAIEAE